MPNPLNLLDNVIIRGVLVGAYDQRYHVQGLEQPVPQADILQYLIDNIGNGDGGTGIDDITEGTTDPSGDPGTNPFVYQNTTNGQIWVWNGTDWILIGPRAPLPAYDNEANAIADGITSGQQWKYKRGNTDGMPAGVVVEQL